MNTSPEIVIVNGIKQGKISKIHKTRLVACDRWQRDFVDFAVSYENSGFRVSSMPSTKILLQQPARG